MRLKRLINHTFKKGNVCVVGLRGTGKDMLMANVVCRRNEPYISNVNYKQQVKKFRLFKRYTSVYIPLEIEKLDCSQNKFTNFIDGDIVPYDYPYPEGCDIYISDIGVYFPSQYCNELNKKYPYLSVFEALSRQIGNCNMHINTQNLNRCWDKIREQSDIYILCNSCKVVGRWVFQTVTFYDKYDACVQRVKPFKPCRVPIFSNMGARATIRAKNDELFRSFEQSYGTVKKHILIYKNQSEYDTRLFKSLLKGDNHDKN